MEDIETLKGVLEAIQNETQPTDGHPDPGALFDCWAKVWERIEEIEKRIKNSAIILGYTREGFPVYEPK